MQVALRSIGTGPNCDTISHNPDVCDELVQFLLYIRRIALKDDNHKKRKKMPAYTRGSQLLGDSRNASIFLFATQNQFLQKNNVRKAPVR